jgi:hypothetical protein
VQGFKLDGERGAASLLNREWAADSLLCSEYVADALLYSEYVADSILSCERVQILWLSSDREAAQVSKEDVERGGRQLLYSMARVVASSLLNSASVAASILNGERMADGCISKQNGDSSAIH